MSKSIVSAIIANFLLLLALSTNVPNSDENTKIQEIPNEIKVDLAEENKIDMPAVSGPVVNLPWENDEDFLKAQEDYNAHTLMGAYCSVLIDPLPGEEHNVKLAARSAKGIVIPPNGIFSQNEMIGPYTLARGYKIGTSFAGTNLVKTEGGGVCKIATTLYNVAILCDLEIIERHNHSMPVNYVPYGQDATVAYGHKDFKFRNTKDYPILIWSEIIGHRLYIGFYGREKSPEVKWSHDVYDIVDYPIYYRNNPNLKEGEKKIVLKGLDGATVKSQVIVHYKDGSTKIRDMGISKYYPLPQIVETGEGQN